MKWLRERYFEGRNVAVIIGSPSGSILLLRPEEWTDGISREEFEARSLSKPEIAKWIKSQC
jgi:hypothetical protein